MSEENEESTTVEESEARPDRPRYKYGVLGAGRQGTAAAYDMVMHGDAEEVRMADVNYEAARQAARLIHEACTALEPLGAAANPLRAFAQFVVKREH